MGYVVHILLVPPTKIDGPLAKNVQIFTLVRPLQADFNDICFSWRSDLVQTFNTTYYRSLSIDHNRSHINSMPLKILFE